MALPNDLDAQTMQGASGPRRSNATEAYELLLAGMEDGALHPGMRLREVDIAQRFNLSRTPVREALKRLELQGLVTHEPHHGAVVAALDYSQVAELFLFRETLEGMAARLAAQHATETEIKVMAEIVERDRGHLDKPRTLIRGNRAFHQQIRNSARNRYLSAALENLRITLAMLSGSTLKERSRREAVVREHAAIVERIAARDPDGAEKCARQHILAAFRVRVEMGLPLR
jgi:DNA-binding GntR family transcriptional regulator